MDETAQINVYHSLSSLMLTKRVSTEYVMRFSGMCFLSFTIGLGIRYARH